LGAVADCLARLASTVPEDYSLARDAAFLYAGGMAVLEDTAAGLFESATTDPVTGERTAPSGANLAGNAAVGVAGEIGARAAVNAEGNGPGFMDYAAATGQVLTGMDRLGNAIVGHDPVAGRDLSTEERISQGLQGAGQGTLFVAGGVFASKLGGAAADTARVAAEAGKSTVYQSIDEAGIARYIGITDNMPARAGQHLRESGMRVRPIDGLEGISRSDARAVEQVLIERHGLSGNGGTLTNKINSISPRNPIYPGAIRRGTDILDALGP